MLDLFSFKDDSVIGSGDGINYFGMKGPRKILCTGPRFL